MTTEVRQLPFKPHMLKGLSHRLLISHYANNNGEPEDVDLFTPFGAPSVLLKRGFGAWHAVGAPTMTLDQSTLKAKTSRQQTGPRA